MNKWNRVFTFRVLIPVFAAVFSALLILAATTQVLLKPTSIDPEKAVGAIFIPLKEQIAQLTYSNDKAALRHLLDKTWYLQPYKNALQTITITLDGEVFFILSSNTPGMSDTLSMPLVDLSQASSDRENGPAKLIIEYSLPGDKYTNSDALGILILLLSAILVAILYAYHKRTTSLTRDGVHLLHVARNTNGNESIPYDENSGLLANKIVTEINALKVRATEKYERRRTSKELAEHFLDIQRSEEKLKGEVDAYKNFLSLFPREIPTAVKQIDTMLAQVREIIPEGPNQSKLLHNLSEARFNIELQCQKIDALVHQSIHPPANYEDEWERIERSVLENTLRRIIHSTSKVQKDSDIYACVHFSENLPEVLKCNLKDIAIAFEALLQESLKRLSGNWVFVYVFHSFNPEVNISSITFKIVEPGELIESEVFAVQDHNQNIIDIAGERRNFNLLIAHVALRNLGGYFTVAHNKNNYDGNITTMTLPLAIERDALPKPAQDHSISLGRPLYIIDNCELRKTITIKMLDKLGLQGQFFQTTRDFTDSRNDSDCILVHFAGDKEEGLRSFNQIRLRERDNNLPIITLCPERVELQDPMASFVKVDSYSTIQNPLLPALKKFGHVEQAERYEKSVLYIDTSNYSADIFMRYAGKHHNWKVHHANSVASASILTNAIQYDAIITQPSVQGKSAWELSTQLYLSRNATTPILLVASGTLEEDYLFQIFGLLEHTAEADTAPHDIAAQIAKIGNAKDLTNGIPNSNCPAPKLSIKPDIETRKELYNLTSRISSSLDRPAILEDLEKMLKIAKQIQCNELSTYTSSTMHAVCNSYPMPEVALRCSILGHISRAILAVNMS